MRSDGASDMPGGSQAAAELEADDVRCRTTLAEQSWAPAVAAALVAAALGGDDAARWDAGPLTDAAYTAAYALRWLLAEVYRTRAYQLPPCCGAAMRC